MPSILPREEDIKIGEKVVCTADGNPKPSVQILVNQKRVGKAGQVCKC